MSSVPDASEAERRALIHEDQAAFRQLVARTRGYYERGRYISAAVHAQIASTYAYWRHFGLFTSPELEAILIDIGKKLVPATPPAQAAGAMSPRRTPQRVLHVGTKVAGIGGHSRMVWRWIQQDSERSHSLVLTRQGTDPVPPLLHEAVNARGGTVHVLDTQRGTIITRARRLQEIAAGYDVVVVHLHCDDVIAMLAFADRRFGPPVAFLDHTDHCFWFGAGISDVVVSLRDTGLHLAQHRRGIDADRCVMLPIVVPPSERTLTRAEAKRALGIAEESVVLLSIARPHKYHPIAGVSYAESVLPVLERYPQAVLLAVGPDHTGDWVRASVQTHGRVRAFGPREDTAVFYQAADIYLDSFPVVSITSLLEAGSFGVPQVSRCLHEGGHSVLCADAPGLMEHLIRTRGLDEFQAAISRLIEDEALRLRTGDESRRRILDVHTGAGWQRSLEAVYARACAVAPVTVPAGGADRPVLDEMDVQWSMLFRNNASLDLITQYFIRGLPLDARLAAWVRLTARNRTLRPDLLLSERTMTRLRQYAPTLSRVRVAAAGRGAR